MEKKCQASSLKSFLLACLIGLTLLSCTSIDKSDLSAEPMSVALQQPGGNVSTIHLVPRYVFLDSDKHSLIVMADTIGPQYHLALTAENAKSCHDLIDIAYLNDMEVELKYDKSNNEVNSVKLLGRKAGTRGHTPLLTTEWVEVFKTNAKTYTLQGIQAESRGLDNSKQRQLVGTCFVNYFYLNCSSQNYVRCKQIMDYAQGHFLFLDLRIEAGTDEIVAVRFSRASVQTVLKGECNTPKNSILPPKE